jgi:hypothetical protein
LRSSMIKAASCRRSNSMCPVGWVKRAHTHLKLLRRCFLVSPGALPVARQSSGVCVSNASSKRRHIEREASNAETLDRETCQAQNHPPAFIINSHPFARNSYEIPTNFIPDAPLSDCTGNWILFWSLWEIPATGSSGFILLGALSR